MRIWLVGVLLAAAVGITSAAAQSAQLVGVGVSRCTVFNQQLAERPTLEDYYFVWAQAFMSGVLLRAEAGRDEGLNLVPAQLPPEQQRQFLKDYCARNPLRYYFHGVAALYQRLGGTSLDFLL
jgi:hypothetical protein